MFIHNINSMIARKEWFGRRKYTGWGVTPRTWQGWFYIVVAVSLLMWAQSAFPGDEKIKSIIALVWLVLLMIDIIPLMFKIKKDEREVQVEAISERNAAWTMVLVLSIWVIYDAVHATLNQSIAEINWFVLGALLGGALVKSITNYILEKE